MPRSAVSDLGFHCLLMSHIKDAKLKWVKHSKNRSPSMGTLANSEDPDEMQHNAAFHQGLHSLQK